MRYSDTCETGKEDFIQDYCDRRQDVCNKRERSGSTPNTAKTAGNLYQQAERRGQRWKMSKARHPG